MATTTTTGPAAAPAAGGCAAQPRARSSTPRERRSPRMGSTFADREGGAKGRSGGRDRLPPLPDQGGPAPGARRRPVRRPRRRGPQALDDPDAWNGFSEFMRYSAGVMAEDRALSEAMDQRPRCAAGRRGRQVAGDRWRVDRARAGRGGAARRRGPRGCAEPDLRARAGDPGDGGPPLDELGALPRDHPRRPSPAGRMRRSPPLPPTPERSPPAGAANLARRCPSPTRPCMRSRTSSAGTIR